MDKLLEFALQKGKALLASLTKKNITNVVVGGVIGSGMLVALFAVLPTEIAAFCAALLGYEAYTLVNKAQHDTISESIWRFAKRPMFPFLCGIGVAEVLRLEAFSHPYAVFFLGFLFGHFFFTPQGSTDYLEEK